MNRREFLKTTGLAAGLAGFQHLTMRAQNSGESHPVVNQSARDIPVAYDCDVAVVGGSTGAVAAATEAARQGADVFLAAPYPYLGEDMCSTYRLWRHPHEELDDPLAQAFYSDPVSELLIENKLDFSYEADLPTADRHSDTSPPSRLKDGKYSSASQQSVQYNGDPAITCHLGRKQDIKAVHVMVYQRSRQKGPGRFVVDSVAAEVSNDADTWLPAGEVTNPDPEQFREDRALNLTVPIDREARHISVHVSRADGCDRVLLGEIVIEGVQQEEETISVPPRPLHVKKTLEKTLLDEGVDFLFGSLPTDVIQEQSGRTAGIVMANRHGRQAVLAPIIVDATPRATVGRMAGAAFTEYPSGMHTFHRVVVGGEKQNVSGDVEDGFRRKVVQDDGTFAAYEYKLDIEMADGSYQSFAKAEQEARRRTFHPGQVDASDRLFQVPPDHVKAETSFSEHWRGGENVPVGCFRPADLEGVYVLGGCADLDREVVEKALRPAEFIKMGRRVGAAASNTAPRTTPLSELQVSSLSTDADVDGDVSEVLSGVRPADGAEETLTCRECSVPVLGDYDVVIAGGGTSGAAAAIAAGRQGADVLVIEHQDGLGGTGTLGMIGNPYHGRKAGFSKEVPFPGNDHTVEDKMEWYRREIKKAGGNIWFGSITCGAYRENGRVAGVAVATPAGRGVVRGDVVIDATGNGDIAVAAGAETMYGSTEDNKIAMQGAGLPPRPLGGYYINTDYLFVDESDMVDVWRTHVGARSGMSGGPFDVAPLLQTRERRRVVGDHVLRYLDQISERTYPDSIVYSSSDYDSHGYPNLPYFSLIPHTEQSRQANHPAPGGSCYTPYRCLLPLGIDGMLVTGLAISMKRDATAMVRMQLDMANQGYAAGYAAARAAEKGISPRDIDVTRLQAHLVEVGNLPKEALEHEDSFPLSETQVIKAVADLPVVERDRACRALAIIMSHRDKALRHVRDAYERSDGPARLQYAKLLGIWGDSRVVPELKKELRDNEWDSKILQGHMAEYAHLPTPVDALVLALGYTQDARALPPILEKTEELHSGITLSHHRSVALALESLGAPEATSSLARLLRKPGMSGHAMTKLETLYRERDKRKRESALREIVLARALYKCGDLDRLGTRTLKSYTYDVRGLFAQHAAFALA